MKSTLAALLLSGIFLTFLYGGTLYFAKSVLTESANEKSDHILKLATAETQQETAENAARLLYFQFSKEGYKADPKMAGLRPILTSRFMPGIFRLDHGVIELGTLEGWCDDAARALIYILARDGIKAEQWNMQGPHSAHAAVKAYFEDGTSALLDPFYGYSSVVDGKPHEPLAVRDALREGKNFVTFLKPFTEKSNKKFYSEYGKMFMGAQGKPLAITAQIPATEKPLVLGTLDGNSRDVYGRLMQNDMTMTWEYAGHKYDRGWTREMVASEPVQVQIILTRAPNEGILQTFTPAPAIDGTKLSWHLLKGEKIISEDGKAAISWTRLKSYIDVDQIVITPQGETP